MLEPRNSFAIKKLRDFINPIYINLCCLGLMLFLKGLQPQGYKNI